MNFNWSDEEQGWVLAAFFYGYLLTQIPGGWLSTYFGGKWVFGLGIFVTVILTLITPLVARINVWCLVAVRVMEGIGEVRTIFIQFVVTMITKLDIQ
ncbi:solute carrier family 17 (anion/sugar transporter), member 5, isoform CRA_b [Oopsacas minuta]|uniref:Solute carrier family 17 (Anion/sugar transporter), member 5, isoform CRA_b n=1 Tax=Oopsacas minuta TaxID=111878 RepID=A0AAV7JJF8_9METZ|nr:solute carrier family 17 (anion/sugar transporter), member 5, isoform CRA_b [Oopsacas minuta]